MPDEEAVTGMGCGGAKFRQVCTDFRRRRDGSGPCQPVIWTFRPHFTGILPEAVSTHTTGMAGGLSGAGP